MAHETWKVSEVARRTGLTIRALHHWDEIGVCVPALRPGGQRLYTPRDLARLQRILVLRGLGLGLGEIRAALDGGADLARLFAEQRLGLERRIAADRALVARLVALETRLARDVAASLDDLAETREVIEMFAKHYTPEQMERLAKRAAELGPEAIAAAQAEWPALIAALRAEAERGTDPSDPRVRALAQRWQELVLAFTGGEPDIARSLASFYRGEPGFAAEQGLDPELFDYVRRASAGE